MNKIPGMVTLGVFQIFFAGMLTGVTLIDLFAKESFFSSHWILFLIALLSLMSGPLVLFLAHLSVSKGESRPGLSEQTKKDLARFAEQGNFNQPGDDQHE